MGYIGQAPANKAVKTADIEDSAITAAKIADGTVVAGELASDSVTTAKILNANVTEAKIADDAITLAKMASGTDGNVISYDASGNPVAIATGSDGQVLTSAGAGQPPAFEAVSGGAALTGSTNNQVVTVTGADAITGEANLIFDGSKLGVSVTPTAQLHVARDSTSAWTGHIESTNSGNYARVLQLKSLTDFDDNSSVFLYCIGNATVRCTISSDGDLQNHDNSYGAISDEKLKQDITDASSQWDDIKNIKVRKFKFKQDVLDKGDSDEHWRIGLVAQEAELVSPKLIKDTPDMDTTTNEFTGTTTKAIKYSILYMKAIKALQESMERIETLEAKVTALENA